MEDPVGKIFEDTLRKKLEEHFTRRKTISNSQYEFQQGRSTINNAMQMKMLVGMESDIKNAFNIMPWNNIIRSLVMAWVPGYLICLIRSYLEDQTVEACDSAVSR